MKLRKETVDITIHCDMAHCANVGRYTSDEGPYCAGWRYIVIHIYDKFNDRTESDISMHVCGPCMTRFQDKGE